MARDVPSLNWQPKNVRRRLGEFQRLNGLPYWYRNGDLPLFARVTDHLRSALREVSRLPGYATPNDLHSWERIARSMVITTSAIKTRAPGGGLLDWTPATRCAQGRNSG